MISVRDNDLVANFHTPNSAGRLPGIITLGGGSIAGIDRANYLASRIADMGYTSLALAYFGIDHLPPKLEEIPLEYFKRAIDWLRSNPSVNPEKVGILGVSKGGEGALLIGATYPEIHAVIAIVPSHVSFQHMQSFQKAMLKSPWTLGGKPVPFVSYQFASYFASLQDQKAVGQALIPVERINGAILLLSGKEDALWPSSLMCDHITERLKAYHFPFHYRHISYNNAGHSFISPGQPQRASTNTLFSPGGTEEGNAAARADAWLQIAQFLEEQFEN